MKKYYYDTELFKHSTEKMKWGIFFNDEEEITIVFDANGEFAGFEDKKEAEKYDSNWEVGNWKDYDIKGEY